MSCQASRRISRDVHGGTPLPVPKPLCAGFEYSCRSCAPMGEGWRQRCALAAGQLVGGECRGGASTGAPTRGRKWQCFLLHVSYPGQSVKSKTPWGFEPVLTPIKGRSSRSPGSCSVLHTPPSL